MPSTGSLDVLLYLQIKNNLARHTKQISEINACDSMILQETN